MSERETGEKLPPQWNCEFCGYGEYILSGDEVRAALRKADHEQFCNKNPNVEHIDGAIVRTLDWPKPQPSAPASVEGPACHICGAETQFACADCRIDLRSSVYVCSKTACRDEHERKCPAKLQAQLAVEVREAVSVPAHDAVPS